MIAIFSLKHILDKTKLLGAHGTQNRCGLCLHCKHAHVQLEEKLCITVHMRVHVQIYYIFEIFLFCLSLIAAKVYGYMLSVLMTRLS